MTDTKAILTFLEHDSWPDSDRPYELVYEPDSGIPRCNFSLKQVHDVAIHDLRPEKGQLSLNRQGYVVADLKSRLSYEDYFNQDKLKDVYLNELKTVLREVLSTKAIYVHECVVGHLLSKAKH